jgi:hypothetical protein
MLFVDAGDDNVTLGVNNIYKNWYDATNTYEPLFQQTGSSFALAAQSQVYQNGANTEGPIKYFGKSRSAAGAVGYTAVADGDILGIVSFQGADGTHFMEGASIRSLVDGTPGVNDVPTNLQFFTNEGTSGASKRWTIETDGNLTPANTAYGIHLGVTTPTASNLLDDYEEGTWTPTMVGQTVSGSLSYSYQNGRYVKVGQMVTAYCYVECNTVNSPLAGNLQIHGFPFAVYNASATYPALTIGYSVGFPSTASATTGYGAPNTTYAQIQTMASGDGRDNLSTGTNAGNINGDEGLVLSMTYKSN